MVGRVAELQIIKGAYYRDLAEGNRVRKVLIMPPRGKIFDKDGIAIADNIAVKKTVVFDPMEGYEKVLAQDDTPESDIITEWRRIYPFGQVFGHISGYLGEVNQGEVSKVDPNCSDKGVRILGSMIGRGGLEQYYDCHLRGIAGEELVEVDTKGNKIRTLGRKPALAGQDIYTTLDYKLQKKALELMQGEIGAVIVSKPTGEILAAVSSPSYDPNYFVDKQGGAQKLQEYFSDKSLPLFNRVIAGAYNPGSIFKMVTTSAAIEEGKIDSDYTYEDTGVVTVDEYEYKNWYFTQYGGVEGLVDPVKALARSTDTFYYKVGELVGPDALASWSRKFGLGSQSRIDLPGEVSGLVPTPEWKKAVKGERWFLGNTYHMSIGQGDLTITPIAAHGIASVFAAKGKLCRPFINMAKGENCADLGLSPESISLVYQGMKAACDPQGTGYEFVDFEPDVACKTGTAETYEKDVTHAWFTVFAPIENPQIVITVLVEKGGEGSKVAAPIARKLMDFIFHP